MKGKTTSLEAERIKAAKAYAEYFFKVMPDEDPIRKFIRGYIEDAFYQGTKWRRKKRAT